MAWPIWPGIASSSMIWLTGGGGCETATDGAPLVIAGGCCAIADSDMVVWMVAVGCSDGGRLLLLMDRCGAFNTIALRPVACSWEDEDASCPLDAVIVLAVMLYIVSYRRYCT